MVYLFVLISTLVQHATFILVLAIFIHIHKCLFKLNFNKYLGTLCQQDVMNMRQDSCYPRPYSVRGRGINFIKYDKEKKIGYFERESKKIQFFGHSVHKLELVT